MKSLALRSLLAALVLSALVFTVVDDASAQCATCPQPVVAYSPVVAQPTVASRPYTGWYWGKWRDQLRLRRLGVSAPTAYTAVPTTYTAAYAPTYTAAYAPTYTAAYRPYVTAYAPLASTTTAPCTTCAQTTAYMPVVQTVARPVVMRPVVAAPACNTCTYTPDCGCDTCATGCSACSTGVSQAIYSDSSCPTCAGGSSSSTSVGPRTPQPSLTPVPEPANSQYESRKPAQEAEADPDPLQDFDPNDPNIEIETDAGSSTFAPPLLRDPRDRTATRTYKSRKPTVDVWNAVYRSPTKKQNVSTTSKPRPRTQAEIDADGWTAVIR